jgi:6-pyruvoyltetrahydropterin/6-carboxytetrahydropterin synthase
MTEHYSVRISKDELVFSASHFITFDGDVCEQLHGHNYRVAVEVEGPLDENHYVVDFIALRDTLRKILGRLDHSVLLPTQHPRIRVEEKGAELEVRFDDRRWVFPRQGCVLLDIPNTTAELLARYIGRGLLDELQASSGTRPGAVCVEVDECFGQVAVYRLSEA